MSGGLGTLQLAACVALAAALASAVAGRLLAPLLRGRIRRLAPASRARLLSGIAVAPLALPLLLVALCLLPSILAAVGVHRDHCVAHGEHVHLCVTHRLPALPSPWSAASVLGALPAVGALGVGLAGAVRSRRLRRALELGAAARLRPDVCAVASPLPLSVTVGVLRPRIFVSQRLAAELPAGQLEVVIEHERAHARRRDGLRALAAAAGSWPYGPALRRLLLGELSLACEQACDAAAARRAGGHLRVADALLRVERMLGAAGAPHGACAFWGSTVPARVAHLLEEDSAQPAPARPLAWALGGVAAALALADPVHHGVEHLVALLLP